MDRDIWLHTELWTDIMNLSAPLKDRLISALRATAFYGPEAAGLVPERVFCDTTAYPLWPSHELRLYNFVESPMPVHLLTLVRKKGRDMTLLALLDNTTPTTAELKEIWDIFLRLEKGDEDDGVRIYFADRYNKLPMTDIDKYETEAQQIYAATKGQRLLRKAQQKSLQNTSDLLGLGPKCSHRLQIRITYYLEQLNTILAQQDAQIIMCLQQRNETILTLPTSRLFPDP